MHRVIEISLTGHADPYRLDEEAFELLRHYLERARSRLSGDPDHAEVIGDLERAVGDKLAALPRTGKSVVDVADVNAVLEEIGAVDVESGEPPVVPGSRGRVRRRLYRITEGQKWAGICTRPCRVRAARRLHGALGLRHSGASDGGRLHPRLRRRDVRDPRGADA